MDVTLKMVLARFKADKSFGPLDAPWSPADFARLNRETGCRLPTQFREMLSEVGRFNHGFGYHFLAKW